MTTPVFTGANSPQVYESPRTISQNFTKTCPLCRRPLDLRQINMTLAMYFCSALDCKYPLDSKCTVIERKLDDIDRAQPQSGAPTDWVDALLEDLTKPEGTGANLQDFSQDLLKTNNCQDANLDPLDDLMQLLQ